jgi:hypothetical protein
LASSSEENPTKPNPRDFRVSLSKTITEESTVPYVENASLRISSVVFQERPPTNSFLLIFLPV